MLHQRTYRRRYRDRPQRTPRRRVIALVIAAAGMLGLLIVGVVLSLASLLGIGSGSHSDGAAASEDSVQRADRMLKDQAVPESADGGRPGRGSSTAARVASSDSGAPIILPAATVTGPRNVATGYPQSAEGAIAQLAAIDVAILQAPVTQGPGTLGTWSTAPTAMTPAAAQKVTQGLITTLGGRGVHRAVPLMARIIRSNAPEHHDVCIAVAAWAHENARLGVHCERMTWDHGHWAIQPARQAIIELDEFDNPAQARRAGFRSLQGAATPDQR